MIFSASIDLILSYVVQLLHPIDSLKIVPLNDKNPSSNPHWTKGYSPRYHQSSRNGLLAEITALTAAFYADELLASLCIHIIAFVQNSQATFNALSPKGLSAAGPSLLGAVFTYSS